VYLESSCKIQFFLSDFNKTRIFFNYFLNGSNRKFYVNPFSVRWVTPWRETNGHTGDMTNIIVALAIFRTRLNTICQLIKKHVLHSKRDCEDFRKVLWFNTTNITKRLDVQILCILTVIYYIFKMLEHILKKRWNLKTARVTSIDWFSWSRCLSYLGIFRIWFLHNLIYFCHEAYWGSRSSNMLHCQWLGTCWRTASEFCRSVGSCTIEVLSTKWGIFFENCRLWNYKRKFLKNCDQAMMEYLINIQLYNFSDKYMQ
jgi:hypothetical protein